MASSLQLSLLIFAGFLGNLKAQRLLSEPFRSRSVCVRGGQFRGQTRECWIGGCPNNWSPHRYNNNYLLCWGPNAVCCVQDDIPPPPPTTETPTTPSLPTINDPECGTLAVTTRIARGEPETPCLSPWQASLRRVLDLNQPVSVLNSNHVAGGVLVQSRWVLTTPLSVLFAGRNTADERFQDQMVVSLGDFNHRQPGDESLYRVRNVYFHRNFPFSPNSDFTAVITESFLTDTDPVWQENAFALIELDRDVQITDCIRPVCLPDGNAERCATAQCKLTGWGADEIERLQDNLQKADMTILDGAACSALEYYLNRTETEVPYPVRTGCAVNEQGSFACVGDFGGPIVCQGDTVNDPRTVEALAVTKLDCDDSVIPMRVSLVREAMEWIEDTILRNS